MRALEDYNKEKNRKLGNMVGVCMQGLWLCSFVMVMAWFFSKVYAGEYTKGLLQQCLIPMIATGALCLVYKMIIMKKERVVRPVVAYLIINLYVVLLLAHPSGCIMLSGLVFGVIALYPLWTNQMLVKVQTGIFALMILVRHFILTITSVSENANWEFMMFVGMLSIGELLYYNVGYVHTQTMILGDATRMDAATGLYNHECFYEELEKRMKEYAQLPEKEREDEAFCLLIADIDNFKKVNDTYGHAFGDEVLLGLAGIFKNYCGSKDLAARYGGEEFVLIVGGCHKKDALTRANTIRRRFADTIFTDASGEAHQFTVSLGVAEYDRPWATASKFFDQADQALYQAKNTGKNRVCSS